ncbi:hypothetical protein HBZS_119750 [Helicobacter bizzozeronii CCUG 35545]|nr:hypothetical protein HBZS_119750 [Helicobacter bizzozeronii CCUG 35545]
MLGRSSNLCFLHFGACALPKALPSIKPRLSGGLTPPSI